MEDNSVLNEDSNIEDVVGRPTANLQQSGHSSGNPRKSMSQPSLAIIGESGETSSTAAARKPGMSGSFSNSNVRSIPIIQTWHENEELKGQLYSLRCEVQMHERRYLEAKGVCHKKVQDVLDEYVEMKIAQEDYDEKMRDYKMLQKELQDMQIKLDNSESNFAGQVDQFDKQRKDMEQRIRDLEATTAPDPNNTTYGTLRGTLDDIMKKDDPDFTLTSGYEERKIAELENKLLSEMDKVAELEDQIKSLLAEVEDQSARLAQSENIRIQLEAAASQVIPSANVPNSTFVIGNARESQTEEQIKYIDELETKLTDAKNESEKARLALVEYMNRCSKLENEIHRLKKSTFDSSSVLIGGQSSEELKAQIEKVTGELKELRNENRYLRIRCDHLTGGDGNLSMSLGQSRLMAGISPSDLVTSMQENETGGTSMRMLPRESQLDDLEENKLPLMDTSAAVRSKEAFDAAYNDFESLKQGLTANPNDTLESSFNASMPPPDRDATQSFLSHKSFKNSPMMKPKPLHMLLKSHQNETAEQIQNHSFSTKTASLQASHCHMPLLQDVQHILDSSAILLEGQHEAAANTEKMQAKMTQIRDALSRLFERLKSSAALFEDILEKMGSSSPLADRIKQMKLAFETSISDHADVSGLLEAAEKDLHTMSVNFSILEKSIITESFVADVSRRFTIAPHSEDVASSSLLNASYSPIFKFSSNTIEVEKLQNEVAELRSELDKARARELKSPLQGSPGRLSDVQIKAAQNFEDLEVCQATLKKIESEKAELESEIAKHELTHHRLVNELEEIRRELEKASIRVSTERKARLQAEEILEETKRSVQQLKKEHENAMMIEVDYRVTEAREQVERESKQVIESLSVELRTALAEENAVRDHLEEMKDEMQKLKRRTKEAEDKVEFSANEKQEMMGHIANLEEHLEKVSLQEKEFTDCDAKLTARKKEIELIKSRDDMELAAIEGLERVRKEIAELTKKTLKVPLIKGDSSSIQHVCDEICRRISRESQLQHESAETLKYVNDKIESLQKDNNELKASLKAAVVNNENVPPVEANGPKTASTSTKPKEPSNFVSPTRQLLHESTMAVDAIVQRLKKTHNMSGMNSELKETIVNLINESRTLRDYLHKKLILFKGIDMTKWENASVDKLVEKLGQYQQDNLILEEEIKKYKKELKLTKAVVPNLGADVQERIKREIGGIAKDMGAVKELRKK
ncbi:hypothetical protein L3Y34_015023 [Caenorhabditis briggsae]|uniref:Uncharacterized protein n=1 Tax=Caenorhabditis briggsae TaxID=6238 RepID=A0AAE9DVF8_CAEBR|nr:hypothetical protein L3Y34_015023 [Caenorhabditis briggsae]